MTRVLVVDDEESVRTMLRTALRRNGWHVAEAAGGDEAVRMYGSGSYDVLVTDIVMPQTNGLTVIRKIREKHPDAKIVAISGGGPSGRLNFLSTARTYPGVRTLEKPFRVSDLEEAVRELTNDPGEH